jgi:hypothetical protein
VEETIPEFSSPVVAVGIAIVMMAIFVVSRSAREKKP